MKPLRPARGPRARRSEAFTITEILVVIAIIVLLIAIAVPAFSSLLGSSERSLAENQLKAAIAAARDAAKQSETGDAAVVFTFTLASSTGGGGHITMIPCIVAGSMTDVIDPTQGASATNNHRREIFVPIANIEPTQLPRGWSVRGFAAPGTIYNGAPGSEPWYELYPGATGNPDARTHRTGNWVFPETAFYDSTGAGNSGSNPGGGARQSFMIRFKAGTGELDTGDNNSALFFDPVADARFRGPSPYHEYRADQLSLENKVAPNAMTWVRRFLSDRADATTADADQRRQKILGDQALDTVLVRPVTEVALYNERSMAAGIGATSLNKTTGTIYGDPTGAMPLRPLIDTSLFGVGAAADEVSDRVDQWIFGKYMPNGAATPVPSDAKIFTVERYLGQAQELIP